MIPSTFVILDHFELLPSGKLDRIRLPEPSSEGTDVGSCDVIETRRASSWREVLELPHVDADTSFFSVGGNSLSAMQLIARIRRDLGVDLEIRSLFAHPTIAGLNEHIGRFRSGQYPPVARLPEQSTYDLSPAQERLWVQSQLQGGEAVGPTPAVFALEGPLDVEAFGRAWEALP